MNNLKYLVLIIVLLFYVEGFYRGEKDKVLSILKVYIVFKLNLVFFEIVSGEYLINLVVL